MSRYRIFAQRIGLIGLVNIILSLNAILLLPILTKRIPVTDYGVWVQVLATVGLLSPIVELGLPNSMVRFLAAAKSKEEMSEGFYSILFFVLSTGAIVSALFFTMSKPIANLLFNDEVSVIRILAVTLIIVCLNEIMLNFFRTFQQIKRYSAYMFVKTILNLVLVGYFVISGYGVWGAVIGYLLSESSVSLLMISNIILNIGIRLPKFAYIKEYISFGIFTVPGALSNWAVSSSSRYVISFFLGTAFVGYYSPGYTLGNIIYMIAAPLAFILPPVLSKYYDERNIESVKFTLYYSLKYFLALAIPSAFGLSILSRPMLTILSTPDIASHSYLVTPFIAVSAILYGAYGIYSYVVVLENRTKPLGIIWIAAGMLNLILNFLLVPYMGILAAAAITLIAYAFAFVLTMRISSEFLRFDIDIIFIIKSIIASLIMSLLLFAWSPSNTSGILLQVGICAIVYFVSLLLLRGFDKNETIFFKNLLKGISS